MVPSTQRSRGASHGPVLGAVAALVLVLVAALVPAGRAGAATVAGSTLVPQGARHVLGWTPVPGPAVAGSAPAVAVYGGALQVFVRGRGGRVLVDRFTLSPGGWSGWSRVPGPGLARSAPAATVYGASIHLFVRGPRNRLYVDRIGSTG